MADDVRVWVHYCGGCNPRYDRVALVQALQGTFPGVYFVPEQPKKPCLAVLAVSGCPVQCARDRALGDGIPALSIHGWDDMPHVQARLAKLTSSASKNQEVSELK